MTKKIKEAVDAGAESMTLEVSSHGLVLGRLRGVEFDVAIFSNLTQDHLDFHGTTGSVRTREGLYCLVN